MAAWASWSLAGENSWRISDSRFKALRAKAAQILHWWLMMRAVLWSRVCFLFLSYGFSLWFSLGKLKLCVPVYSHAYILEAHCSYLFSSSFKSKVRVYFLITFEAFFPVYFQVILTSDAFFLSLFFSNFWSTLASLFSRFFQAKSLLIALFSSNLWSSLAGTEAVIIREHRYYLVPGIYAPYEYP